MDTRWWTDRCYDLTKLLLWVAFRVGFGLEVRGQKHVPQRGGFVVASNHVSYLDPPLIGVACPRQLSFMARSSLFGHLPLGAFLRAVHVIPIARGERDMGAIREALSRLRHGDGVAIFPEGGRQLSGALGAAKRGVGLLAAAARVPIVPAVVSGTFQALPPSSNRLRLAKIRVAFGPAIPYTGALVSPTSPSAADAVGGEAEATPPRSCHQDLADAVTQAWRRLAEQWNEPLNR
ncbi:MAG: 1-acyl-sn-glycerol-3-phosphate acyltransferase [Candidatus Omnitrophica bacterium]|nr:1-acyl-sn-glycerol-3-phosphate acyltransferase [Candidatus Omnitrophota bacterium]MBI3083721.1 1-acyl-sn-glycerol-3-phosphate acyltransferase [Candidatus Omnitrophota bacterium]